MKRVLSWGFALYFGACLGMAEDSQGRRVRYGENDVITVRTRVRFTTLVILPKEESILDFTCGDKEFWVVDGTRNLAYIKPAKAGSKTNVNLVTASGNVYSLLLEEVSDKGEAADLKLFIEPKDDSVLSTMHGEPRFVSAEELASFRDQVSLARDETLQAKQAAEHAIDSRVSAFLADYPGTLRFDYRYLAGKKPFFIDSIWNDGRFTYIRTGAREAPAVYELADGKPSLVDFDFRGRTMIIRKVVDQGYLAIGKARLRFYRREKN